MTIFRKRKSGFSIPTEALQCLAIENGAVGFWDKKGTFVIACKELPEGLEASSTALKMIENSLRNPYTRNEIENDELYFSVDMHDGSALYYHRTLKGYRKIANQMGLKGDAADAWIEDHLLKTEKGHWESKNRTKLQRWLDARFPRRQHNQITLAPSLDHQ